MLKSFVFLYLFGYSLLAADQCFSVQILEVTEKYLIDHKLEQNDMPSGCKLMSIDGRFYGRCGCYSTKAEALNFVHRYPNLSKTKSSVEKTKTFRFHSTDVTYKKFRENTLGRSVSKEPNLQIPTTPIAAPAITKTDHQVTPLMESSDDNSTPEKSPEPITATTTVASVHKPISNTTNTPLKAIVAGDDKSVFLANNTEIRIPIWFMKQAIVVLGLLSGLTFIIIIIYKIYVERQHRATVKLKANIQSDIEKAIQHKNFNSENFMTPVSQAEFYSFSDVAIDFINNIMHIGSGSKSSIHHLLDDKNIIKYLKTLSSKKWSLSRIEAIEKLGLMHYEKNKFFLFSLIESETSNSRLVKQAIIGLSYIIRQDDIKFFLDEFVQTKASGKYFEFVFTNIIKRMLDLKQEDGVLDILYYLYQIENNQTFIRPFVEAIGYTGFDYIQDEFYDLYFMSQSNNVKASIVRAIGVLQQNDKCDEIILLALKSENEVLRIAASKSLSVVNVSKHYNELSNVLLDKNYNVRLNASVSLAQSQSGLSLLEEIFQSSPDVFAKEMAKYAIVVAERDRNHKPKIVQ